jgi:hypothetical protein
MTHRHVTAAHRWWSRSTAAAAAAAAGCGGCGCLLRLLATVLGFCGTSMDTCHVY